MATPLSRRTWLKRTGLAMGTIAGSGSPTGPFILADPSPNSKLNTAVIRCGGRGEASLAATMDEWLVAIVDVEDTRLDTTAKRASEVGKNVKVEWDAANMCCDNLPELNRWVKRECRPGWEV